MKGLGIYAIAAVALGGIYWFVKMRGGITFSRNPAKQGDFLTITAKGLMPSTPLTFGWEDVVTGQDIISTAGTSSAAGTFTWLDTVLPTTAPGRYRIWVDQESSGGKAIGAILTVIAA